jgi:hypothetical protein
MVVEVNNVSPVVSAEYMPANRDLAIYDTIFLSLTDKITPELLDTLPAMMVIKAVSIVLEGGYYAQAGLATILWRIALTLDIKSLPFSGDNLLEASACQTIDRVRLSFHSFFIFTSVCGSILTICLGCLVGVAAARRPVIANSFSEIHGFILRKESRDGEKSFSSVLDTENSEYVEGHDQAR